MRLQPSGRRQQAVNLSQIFLHRRFESYRAREQGYFYQGNLKCTIANRERKAANFQIAPNRITNHEYCRTHLSFGVIGSMSDRECWKVRFESLMIAKFLSNGYFSKLSPEQLLYVQNCLDVFFISGNICMFLYYIFPLLYLGVLLDGESPWL